MQRLILLLLLISSCLIAFGQNVENITKWTVKVSPADIRSGESGQLILTGTTVKGWHIYSTKEVLKGPYPTTFTVTGQGIETRKLIVAGSEVSEVIEPTPLKKFDPNFNLEVGYFEGEVSFKVPFTVKAGTNGKVEVGVKVLAQACNENGCQRPYGPDLTATIAVSPGEPRPDRLATAEVQKAPRNDQATQFNAAKNDGLLSFFFFAFISGLGALITPCVFPMIPVTVSFFTKKAGGSLKEQLKGAALYCAGIIGTFTVLGLGITSLFGAANLNRLATNLWVNLFLGLLFIALSFSLFGVFELALPSSVLTKMDSLGRKGGALAPIFMGTTFS
ncbi:MAG: hypothetical protein K8R88_04680 [Armatimonadetes bacterium]|nr:hypothetical protein [Armatimonadota bacterium]